MAVGRLCFGGLLCRKPLTLSGAEEGAAPFRHGSAQVAVLPVRLAARLASGYHPAIPSCRGITGHTASDRGPVPSPSPVCL